MLLRWTLLVAALCGALVIAAPLLTGGEWLWTDLSFSYLPTAGLMHGRWPLLEVPATNRFGGLRLLYWADPIAAVQYPPIWLYSLLPPLTGLLVLAALHTALATAGMTLLLRRLGIGPAAALAAAPLWSLAPWTLAHLVHPNFLACTAWLPWSAWLALGVQRSPQSWRSAVALALVAALTVLGGSLELALLWAGVVVALLLRQPDWRAQAGPVALRLVVAAGLAVALSAPAWLPLLQALPQTVREVLAPATPGFALEPAALLRLLNPTLWGHPFLSSATLAGGNEQETYLGALPWLLLPWALRHRRRDAWIAVVLLLIGWTLALLPVRLGPLLRVSSRLVVIAVFAATWLGAQGLDSWLVDGASRRSRWPLAVAVLWLIGFALGWRWIDYDEPLAAALAREGWGLALLTLLAGLALILRPPSSHGRRAVLAALLCAAPGLWLAARVVPRWPAGTFAQGVALAGPLRQLDGRVIDASARHSTFAGLGPLWGVETVATYNHLLTVDAWQAIQRRSGGAPRPQVYDAAFFPWVQRIHDPAWAELGVAGVLTLAAQPPAPGWQRLWGDEYLAVDRAPWPAQRAWYPGGEVQRSVPGDDTVHYRLRGPGGLVITDEVLGHGAQLWLDGQPASWTRHDERIAFTVAAGEHHAELRWEVPGRRAGLGLAGLGALLAAALVWPRRRGSGTGAA